ncbi:MAG: sensor histidine kinase [Bacteroidales bacterium]
MHWNILNFKSLTRSIYSQKDRWKWIFLVIAIVIIAISLWYTDRMVSKLRADDRKNVKTWAQSIKKKREFVLYDEKLFKQLSEEEDTKVELLANAYHLLHAPNNSESLTLVLEIIKSNENIPIVVTNGDIIDQEKNTDGMVKEGMKFEGKIKEMFSEFKPISIPMEGQDIKLHYRRSKIYTELHEQMNNLENNFFDEVASNSNSVPVIITDSTQINVIRYGNIPISQMKDPYFARKTLNIMKSENEPIHIDFIDQGKSYIFYKDRPVVTEFKYFPITQMFIIAVFVFTAYLIFSTSRKSEQNQVWVGMSKETAHQLGTPLSSLIGWTELLRLDNVSEDILSEIDKDLVRLQKITERFSKVGSPSELLPMNVVEVIYEVVDYLRPRTSRKVNYVLNIDPKQTIIIPLNAHLFGWVIENLCKNAIDAMSGAKGQITINLKEDSKFVFIDVKDTGKGIPKGKFKRVFYPGYTTKKRGWGLGLSLTRRIIKNYHKGKIFVKNSVIDAGTTFRIILKK